MLPSERATEIVAQRGETYGHPADVYAVSERMYSALAPHVRKRQIPGEETALHLICHKIARELVGRHADDNLDDVCGYVNVWAMCLEREQATREGS